MLNRRSIILFVLGFIFFALTYFSGIESKAYEERKEAEIRSRGGLVFFHGRDEMNNWDLAGMGFLVLGAACWVASVRLAMRKMDDTRILSVGSRL
jgi:hypothetical protein